MYNFQAAVMALCLFGLCRAWQPHSFSDHRYPVSTRYHLHILRAVERIDESLRFQPLELNDDVVPFLAHQLQKNDGDQPDLLFRVEGYLTTKRALGKSFCFLDLSRRGVQVPVQAMLKRQSFGNETRFDGMMKSLVPGIALQITGPVSPTRNPGEAVIEVYDMNILKLPRNPQHVSRLLRLVQNGLLEPSDVAPAANRTEEELVMLIQQHTKKLPSHHPKLFHSLAKEILRELRQEQELDTDYPDLSKSGNHTHTTSMPVAPHSWKNPPKTLCSAPEIVLTGWVRNRRRFQGAICTLEVDVDPTREPQQLKCILHPRVIPNSHIRGQLYAPGSHVQLNGWRDNGILWVTQSMLLRSSWRPNVVQFLLEQSAAENVDHQEAARALQMPHAELERIVSLPDPTQRQWESAEITRRLQGSARQEIDPNALKILERFEPLRAQYPVEHVEVVGSTAMAVTDFVSTPASRWRRKKEPQLEWMTQQVMEVLRNSYPGKFQENGNETLRVLDVGGGKGFLANHLARQLIAMRYRFKILVVDLAEGAIHNGRQRAERRKISDVVEYLAADASTVELQDGVDLVVALHACGVLTDVALGHAVNHEAAFVVCPCCFRSNPTLRPPQTERSSMTVEEWLDVKPQEYNSLKSLAEVQGDIDLATRATYSICALRLSAVDRLSSIVRNSSIRTFPLAYSTRNFCLVGEVH